MRRPAHADGTGYGLQNRPEQRQSAGYVPRRRLQGQVAPGLPGLSIPCGYKNGLPIGMQLIGKALDEATLLRVAYTFEQNRTDLRKPSPMGEVEL